MKFKSTDNLSKITAGILLPIFLFNLLFLPVIVATAGSATAGIKVVFKLKPGEINFFAKYGLADARKLHPESNDLGLSRIYKAVVSGQTFSEIQSSGSIEYIQADGKVEATTISTNDTYFTNDPQLADKQWYLPKIKMAEAWEYGQGKGNVTVAVIDTGIHASHLELNDGRVVAGYNTITNKPIAANSDSDDNGHGTAVSGIIGAIPNNNVGIAGINWKIKIMPLKALESDGTGDISSVAAAIVWAVDHGANTINLSLGGQGFGADQALNEAIQYAYNRDAVVVSAAGNDLAEQGVNLDSNPIYPICADNGKNMVIGVAASDIDDKKAAFSNFGINCVDITAPGKKILTTAYLPSDPSNNVLIYGSGTSVAAPIVSGIAALLKSNNFDLTNTRIRDIIINSADNIDKFNTNNCLNTSCSGFLGRGRVNALSALQPQPLLNGSLVRDVFGKIYLINGGMKQYVPSFVFQQRGYDAAQVVNEANNQLAGIPNGEPLPPLNGTLIKGATDPTVYYIDQGIRRPLTYAVFVSRNFSFANVKTMPNEDVNVLKIGEWYEPPNGTMVLIKGDPTVYVMADAVRRPVTYFVFTQRKLSFAKVISVTTDEFSHIPKAPDAYWLAPIEGTLVKSSTNPTVYLIQDQGRKPLTGEAFANRKFKFSSIVSLPQAEIDVILPGSPILK